MKIVLTSYFLCNLPFSHNCFSTAQCDDVKQLENGEITYGTDGLTTTASFTCDLGATLNGSHQLTCSGEAGEWSSPQPTCGNVFINLFLLNTIQPQFTVPSFQQPLALCNCFYGSLNTNLTVFLYLITLLALSNNF